MKHVSHEHSLILNEVYIAKEGDACRGCKEEIVSCKSFVYSCSLSGSYYNTSTNDTNDHVHAKCVEFLLHKSCAELPPTIKNPNDDNMALYLLCCQDDSADSYEPVQCSLCGCDTAWSGFIYISSGNDTPTVYICARCAVLFLEDVHIYQHPAHPQHALKFINHLSSFRCYACKVDDNIKDLSYICTKCRFWIHKSCADAPASFQFQFHDKHPLKLSFSLPEVYRKFVQYCKICSKKLCHGVWLYYCPKCRFFVHFHCARSNRMKRSNEDEIYDSNVVHLPAADESSADLLAEQFVMAISTLSTPNCFRHWAHDEHDLQLMTINELNDQKLDDDISLLCDGCVKPIRTDQDNNHFYGCVPCNYFLHKACAALPRKIKQRHFRLELYAHKYSYPLCYYCVGCEVFTNGIIFSEFSNLSLPSSYDNIYHIGCLALPEMIKHEAHSHQLNQVFMEDDECNACGEIYFNKCKHFCAKCSYYICARCIMRPRTVNHRWDPHPLRLIYDPGMVSSDHEHDFECEYCSNEINTNYWFYHCSDCDLSFHLGNCFEESSYRTYSNVKFGAVIHPHKLHHHNLTYVLNKKFRSCEKCHRSPFLNYPVLECAACKVIFCVSCWTEGG